MEVSNLSSTEILICTCWLLPLLSKLLRGRLKRANDEVAFHSGSLNIPAKKKKKNVQKLLRNCTDGKQPGTFSLGALIQVLATSMLCKPHFRSAPYFTTGFRVFNSGFNICTGWSTLTENLLNGRISPVSRSGQSSPVPVPVSISLLFFQGQRAANVPAGPASV